MPTQDKKDKFRSWLPYAHSNEGPTGTRTLKALEFHKGGKLLSFFSAELFKLYKDKDTSNSIKWSMLQLINEIRQEAQAEAQKRKETRDKAKRKKAAEKAGVEPEEETEDVLADVRTPLSVVEP